MSLTLCPTDLQSTKGPEFFVMLKKNGLLKQKQKKNCVFPNSVE